MLERTGLNEHGLAGAYMHVIVYVGCVGWICSAFCDELNTIPCSPTNHLPPYYHIANCFFRSRSGCCAPST